MASVNMVMFVFTIMHKPFSSLSNAVNNFLGRPILDNSHLHYNLSTSTSEDWTFRTGILQSFSPKVSCFHRVGSYRDHIEPQQRHSSAKPKPMQQTCPVAWKLLPSWLSQNINIGRFDYFYWLLTVMSVVNFGVFLCCTKKYKYRATTAEGNGNSTTPIMQQSKQFVVLLLSLYSG